MFSPPEEKDEFTVSGVQSGLNKLAFQRKAKFPVQTSTNIKQIQLSDFEAPVKLIPFYTVKIGLLPLKLFGAGASSRTAASLLKCTF